MTARSGRGELEQSVEVAPGVTLTWDPARPRRCVDVSIAGENPEARLVGVDRGPWLRLAAVSVLDHVLYLPLDRSLLDAELAAAQLEAARTLGPAEPTREYLIGRALVGARRASRGMASYLERFVAENRRPPPVLAASLGTLARCYSTLTGEVRDFDASLATVTHAWRRMSAVECTAPRRRRVVAPPIPVAPSRLGAAQLDPRLLPARVLRLGPTIDTAEISVDPVRREGGDAVRVRVDAFLNEPAPDRGVDIGVRLIDHRSGETRGYGLLGRPVSSRPELAPHFEGTLSLPGSMSAPDVRVDVFGPAVRPAAAPARGTELRQVRRATIFLANWRALVADVRLWGTRTAPAARLRAIVEQISGDHPTEPAEPLWSEGPSRSDLLSLAESGDRTLTGWLRTTSGVVDGEFGRVVGSVSGPGDLLAAEVAAAHERER